MSKHFPPSPTPAPCAAFAPPQVAAGRAEAIAGVHGAGAATRRLPLLPPSALRTQQRPLQGKTLAAAVSVQAKFVASASALPPSIGVPDVTGKASGSASPGPMALPRPFAMRPPAPPKFVVRSIHVPRAAKAADGQATPWPPAAPRLQSKSLVQRSAATSSSAAPAFTRGAAAKLGDEVAANAELKRIYSGVTNSYGTTFEQNPELFLRQQKEVENSSTNRRPAQNFGEGARLVIFEYDGAKHWGLDPGVDALFKCEIEYTGTRTGDFALARAKLAAAGRASHETADTVWHHYHDYNATTGRGTLFLMTKSAHNVPHHGGMFQFNGTT